MYLPSYLKNRLLKSSQFKLFHTVSTVMSAPIASMVLAPIVLMAALIVLVFYTGVVIAAEKAVNPAVDAIEQSELASEDASEEALQEAFDEGEVVFSFETAELSEPKRPLGTLERSYTDNIRTFIDLDQLVGVEERTEQLSYLDQQCKTALQAFGYYQAKCQSEIKRQSGALERLLKKDFELLFKVDLGEPVKVGEWAVSILGEAADTEEIQEYLAQQPLQPSTPFRHDYYESLKQALLDLSFELGFFDAQYLEQRVKLSIKEGRADVTLTFQGGARYRFGEIQLPGSQIDRALLESLSPFSKGAPYNAMSLVEYNNKLLQTQYFSSVRVTPDVANAKDLHVPIVAKVIMKSKNTMRFGLGYATDVRTRGRVEWVKPWVNSRGRRVAVKTELSAIVQSVGLQFKAPVLGAVERQYEQSIGWERDEAEDRETIRAALTYRMPIGDWQVAPFVRIEQERYVDLNIKEEAVSLIPGFEVWRRRKRGVFVPTWGDFLRVGVEMGLDEIAAEEDFYRVTISGKLIRQPFERQRILLGLNLGGIVSDGDVTELPDSLRFLAGGDQSIRGFAYKEIGAEYSADVGDGAVATDTESARHLATLSVEYDWAFKERWRVALFVDAGDAFNNNFNMHVGSGIGLRWISPVGPIKLDGAYSVSEEPTVFRLHFSMGLDI